MTKYNQPRVSSSKKDSKCAETGKEIRKFQEVLIVKGENGIEIYSKESDKYKEFIQALNKHIDVR